MGLLDQLANAASQAAQATQSPGQDTDLMATVGPLLERFGGVQGLVQQLQQGDLAPLVASWLGRGENAAVSAQQLQHALGDDSVQAMAEATGQSAQDWSQQLSQILPGLIDQLSPNGELDASGAVDLGGVGQLLGQFLGRA
jgi:uncharacterized protein YidB (DUF937 family)